MPNTRLRPRCCGPLMSATITASRRPFRAPEPALWPCLGLKGSRLYLLQDYKVAWVSLEHPMLMLGFLASRRLPDRAVEWAGALAQGKPRNDALLLLERDGLPPIMLAACRGPRPSNT